MTQGVVDIAAATAAQASPNTATNSAPWPVMQPDLSSVNFFNEILAGTRAGGIESQKQIKSVKKDSLDPEAMSRIQQTLAHFSIDTEFGAKILSLLSSALKTLNSMQ